MDISGISTNLFSAITSLKQKRLPTGRLPNLWELPGGKIKPDETPEECLKRELNEEFDIDVVVGEHIDSNIHAYAF